MATYDQTTKSDGLQEKMVAVNRHAKVVKVGRIFSFSAIVVVGDGVKFQLLYKKQWKMHVAV
jgi:ribosomal protein S5